MQLAWCCERRVCRQSCSTTWDHSVDHQLEKPKWVMERRMLCTQWFSQMCWHETGGLSFPSCHPVGSAAPVDKIREG